MRFLAFKLFFCLGSVRLGRFTLDTFTTVADTARFVGGGTEIFWVVALIVVDAALLNGSLPRHSVWVHPRRSPNITNRCGQRGGGGDRVITLLPPTRQATSSRQELQLLVLVPKPESRVLKRKVLLQHPSSSS